MNRSCELRTRYLRVRKDAKASFFLSLRAFRAVHYDAAVQCRNCGYSRETLSEFASCPECGMPDASWAAVPRLKRTKARTWGIAWLVCLAAGASMWFPAWLASSFVAGVLGWGSGITGLLFMFFLLGVSVPAAFAWKIAILHRRIEPREYRYVTWLRALFHCLVLWSAYMASFMLLLLFFSLMR